MKVTAEIKVYTDDYNSYPPDLKIEVTDEFVTLGISEPDREITVKRAEFDKFVELFYGKRGNA